MPESVLGLGNPLVNKTKVSWCVCVCVCVLRGHVLDKAEKVFVTLPLLIS